MIAQEAGKVINLASVLGAAGCPATAAYAASKGGVIALTRALAVEWARHNIQVNAIAPGWFVTDDERGGVRRPRDPRATDPGHPGPADRSARGDRPAGRVPGLSGLNS